MNIYKDVRNFQMLLQAGSCSCPGEKACFFDLCGTLQYFLWFIRKYELTSINLFAFIKQCLGNVFGIRRIPLDSQLLDHSRYFDVSWNPLFLLISAFLILLVSKRSKIARNPKKSGVSVAIGGVMERKGSCSGT